MSETMDMMARQRSSAGVSCASGALARPVASANAMVPTAPSLAVRIAVPSTPFCRAQEAADEIGVLLAGPALHARGDIDDAGARYPDRLGDVVRRQPAG